jgi:hypothetical protein
MKTCPPLLAIVATLLAGLSLAHASLTRAMDLAELTAAAEQVVVAEVAKVESQWDKDHRTISSTIEIRVQESWKGPTPSDGKLLVQQPGGAVGEIEMTVVGMPTFSIGERAVLFLQQARVVGMGQGKRPLHWDGTSKRWFAEPGDAAGAVRVGRDGQLHATERSARESIDSLRTKVRALLEK